MGKGSGRGLGRVGSDFLSAIGSGLVGSRFRQVGSKKNDPWTTLGCVAPSIERDAWFPINNFLDPPVILTEGMIASLDCYKIVYMRTDRDCTSKG